MIGAKPLVLGFMAIRENNSGGLRCGYLLTTGFGRPIEFHYTSEVRFQRQQRVLFGASFEAYAFAELLAKPLTDRQSTAPRIILVNRRGLLELRRQIPAPVVFLAPLAEIEVPSEQNTFVTESSSAPFGTACLPEFAQDTQAFEKIRSLAAANFDWHEPFERLDQALAEITEPSVSSALPL
jgi:hypothetical protein